MVNAVVVDRGRWRAGDARARRRREPECARMPVQLRREPARERTDDVVRAREVHGALDGGVRTEVVDVAHADVLLHGRVEAREALQDGGQARVELSGVVAPDVNTVNKELA